MNNANFPENKIAPLFLHTHTKNNFVEQKQHGMKEWSISNKYKSLSGKIVYKLRTHYLHFALISMETKIL